MWELAYQNTHVGTKGSRPLRDVSYDVVLALLTLMTEFSTVRVSGSSWDGFKTLKLNSPVRISLTGLAGSSCTQSIAVSVADLEQFPGVVLNI